MTTPLPELATTGMGRGTGVTRARRGVILGSLLALAIAAPGHALVKKVPIAPGSTQLVPYSPPYVPPQPPLQPGTPVITGRASFSISLGFIIDDPSTTANAIERSGANGIWTVLKTYGPLRNFQQFTDYGDPIPTSAGTATHVATGMTAGAASGPVTDASRLTPDTMYCYRVRSTNQNGSTLSSPQCVYTREYVTDAKGTQVTRSVSRVQLRIRTADITNADTGDDVAVLLNSASTTISVPALNHTWVDSPRPHFRRGGDDLLDLSTDHLIDIGDIQIISIQKSGDDAWCLAGFDLIVNDQSHSGFDPANVLFTKSFASLPGGCLWLTNATATSNIFTVDFPQLRATPGWSTFLPQPLPIIPLAEVQGILESRLGDSFHGSARWGDSGSVTLTPNWMQNQIHADVHFEAEVDDAPNPEVHAWFDLAVSGGCQSDNTLTFSIAPVNVHVDASLGVLGEIGAAFECVGTERGNVDCIQSGVEKKVREAFTSLAPGGFTVDGSDECRNNPTFAWQVSNTGDIFLD
jgi:hypothetical protein